MRVPSVGELWCVCLLWVSIHENYFIRSKQWQDLKYKDEIIQKTVHDLDH